MDDEPIVWVPNAQVWREIGKSRQTLHRWDRDPRMAALGWPPPIKPNGNPNGPISRDRRKLDAFKRRAMAEGLLHLRKESPRPTVEAERGVGKCKGTKVKTT